MKNARIYIRVSTQEQDTTRQERLIEEAKAQGFYIAGVYKEKASGARVDRPELERMLAELQPGDVVIAEKLDRISRLPLPEAEKLVATIKDKGAKLAVPGVVDFSELVQDAKGTVKIVLEATQDLLLKLALQAAREDYETRRQRQAEGIQIAKSEGKYKGRKADTKSHANIIAHRTAGKSIAETAQLVGCSEAQVKKVWAAHKKKGQN